MKEIVNIYIIFTTFTDCKNDFFLTNKGTRVGKWKINKPSLKRDS